ncbi:MULTISPECIES: response regulator transcription factor [unclassified Clostridioides]|uniref:response regulator transcription factor n=1 Tax=unclassified Clostridioides TaxID=2635829 RepID=UPI001D1073AC|nr:response regulator transcription factor [Clostridioides sp. ZZV14-6150]MCC0660512.1 response regulator transcription factor [Clostridioides sp. ZZV14-6154]MCC0669608.1 response regulator transcription factor [Clostridioides sp. ZZV14-6153]MCC0718784.1 response regulator transcription factor [Clostridioides sp. ZZV14-6105]MCC0723373.1 response regulator transcription factor [Clostridioides sp. ZZV14-6104]MCC0726612.1 response regulator transcription factor [Clostridioides sp. ZZV14-6045]MCC
MAKILVVEDEKRMQDIIVEYMQKGGYTCITADDGVEALTILKNTDIDLMILDIMMPYLDGFSVCRVSREITNIPIIMLTAKGEEEDKLKGYEYGADDYITKPFSPKVLLAKVTALLRRYTVDIPKSSLSVGKIFIILKSRQVYVEDKLIDLTYKEFELLRLFVENPNQVFSRDKLLNCIWGYDFEGNTRTVDTHIKTLRKKLGNEGHHIVTLIRSGYKFEVK